MKPNKLPPKHTVESDGKWWFTFKNEQIEGQLTGQQERERNLQVSDLATEMRRQQQEENLRTQEELQFWEALLQQ